MVEPLYGTAELGFVFVNLHIDVASQVKKTMMLLVALFTGEPDDGVRCCRVAHKLNGATFKFSK